MKEIFRGTVFFVLLVCLKWLFLCIILGPKISVYLNKPTYNTCSLLRTPRGFRIYPPADINDYPHRKKEETSTRIYKISTYNSNLTWL